MKILHIDTGREWRGGQRQALFLHEGLLRHGHESLMVCHSSGELIKRTENPVPLAFKSEADPVYIFKLLKIIKEYKPDIVHSHDSHSLTPCIAASWIDRSFKLVHTRRVDFPLKKKFFNKYKSRKVTLAAVSGAVRDIMAESGIDKGKIALIYDGSDALREPVPARAEELRRKYNPEGKKVIGMVANFADHKDYPTLLKAFEELYSKRQDVLLLPVGDGPLFNGMKELAATLKCNDGIAFTGFVSDIPEILSIMDIFTMSSKTEGLCTSIIDAMNANIPVAATKAGGIPELVIDGETGILSDVKDYKALANSYDLLLNDPGKAKKLAENAKKRAAEFSTNNMTIAYIELYKKILK